MRLGIIVAMLALAAGPLGAQASGTVLVLPASARAAGVGDAAALVSGTAGALFYGAARLPNERAASMSAGSWIGGAQLASFAASMPAGGRRVLALGVQSLDYGSADEIVPDPLSGGKTGTATGDRVGANELAATVGLAERFGRLRFGMALAIVHQQVADVSATTLAVNLGEGITVGGWDIDGSVEHAELPHGARAARTFTLPATYRGGVTTPSWAVGAASWRGIAEYRWIRDAGSTGLAGAEGSYATGAGWMLQVRGAALAYAAETERAPWSAGGSAARGAWSLDYAYQGYGALGAVHRMGVSWRSRPPHDPSR